MVSVGYRGAELEEFITTTKTLNCFQRSLYIDWSQTYEYIHGVGSGFYSVFLKSVIVAITLLHRLTKVTLKHTQVFQEGETHFGLNELYYYVHFFIC